jgi:hypothetical protein
MSRKRKTSKNPRDRREYRLSVRAVRRETPDVNKLARAIIDLAMAQAEAEAQGENKNQAGVGKKSNDEASGSADE